MVADSFFIDTSFSGIFPVFGFFYSLIDKK
jgi:hypothetical protein